MIAQTKTRAEFDEAIAELHMLGQWKFDEQQTAPPGPMPPGGIPYIWKWAAVHGALLEACDVMPESMTLRRNVMLINPALQQNPGTSATLAMGVQLVVPGEFAWAHRHTMGAVRFGIAGDERLYTVVDGDRLPLMRGDLVLTPSWTWHDHHNESDVNGIWLDLLDVPLLFAINQVRYQPFGESAQPLHQRQGEYGSARAALARPAWEERRTTGIPLRYAWQDVRQLLEIYRDGVASPYDDIMLEYVNPMTGGPTLPSLACFIQLLRPGFVSESHRHATSALYHVVEGEGVTTCGDTELNWSAGDSFVIPNWLPHRHENRSASNDAILFSATDEPVLNALGLSGEDPAVGTYRRPAPIAPGNLVRR